MAANGALPRCLVLGANGFIGSHLVQSLVAKGYSVRSFDRSESGSADGTEKYAGDFLNEKDVEAALQDIDYVFHLVSTTTPMIAENDPLIDIQTNILMSVKLFELCVKAGVKKVIFASTGGAIYGNVDGKKPLHEDVVPKPVSPYAIGKLTIENYLRYFKKKHNLDFMVTRISNPYGPGQNPKGGQGVIAIFLDKLQQGEPITIFGDGSMIRDYIYVKDVANMLAESFHKNNKEDVYNIGSGHGRSVNEIIGIIENVTGRSFKKETKPAPRTFVQNVVLDASRYVGEFGSSERTEIEKGIRYTWQHVQKQKK